MRVLIAITTLFFCFGSFAQTEDVLYQYNKGKKYIMHTAQAGNTLWGLHTTYNVSVDDIVAVNPTIKKGVQEGVVYLIPVGVADGKYAENTQILEHVVVKGDTPFSVAKKHGVTVDELSKLNPGISAGLKLGQIVKIPVKQLTTPIPNSVSDTPQKPQNIQAISFSDTILHYVVKDNETMYSISKRFMVPVANLTSFNQLKSTKIKEGDTLLIPLKKEKISQAELHEVPTISEPPHPVDTELLFKKKEKYVIGVLLPFDLDSKGSNSLKTVATEFYMGLQLAVDSLEKEGFNATVKIIDFPSDSVGIITELKKPEYKKMDMIIGPLLPQNADIVGDFCKLNKIRMICPAAVNASLLKNNPYVYAAVSSDITQQRILAAYAVKEFASYQIVLVNTGVKKDQELYDAFRLRFLELAKTNGNLKLIEVKATDFTTFIRKNGNTLFVVPTRDKVAASKFMGTLYKINGKATTGAVVVFGTKEWGTFDEISGFLKTKYALHWATSSDLNYTLEETKTVVKQYRLKYKSDMNKVAVQGFDVMHYFVSTLLLEEKVAQEVANDFDMKPVSNGAGYENRQCFIVKHEDYQLIRMGVFHE